MKLSGEVKEGRLILPPVAWAIAAREFEGRRVTVEIDKEKSIRSVRANARYWTILVPLASHHLGKTRDIQLSKDQTHWILASAFVGIETTDLGAVPKETHTLSTEEFYNFTEEVSAWLTGLGYPIPEQGEPVEMSA